MDEVGAGLDGGGHERVWVEVRADRNGRFGDAGVEGALVARSGDRCRAEA